MSLRSARERAIQTFCYEIGGLLLAAPVFSFLFGKGTEESFVLIATLAVAVLLWSPVHNSVFDWVEWRVARRVASDRPHGWRIVHALSHEATALIVTLPVILYLTDFSLAEALLLDIGLTLFCAGYAYVFHIGFDWLRPVEPPRPQPIPQETPR